MLTTEHAEQRFRDNSQGRKDLSSSYKEDSKKDVVIVGA